ncbi:hypothetical protein [Methylobacterium planeticum]|uniref:hypothetical protein n=1 Tax=Methylobacterium planeticum TaxID=2615211 RepID=UPI00177ED596|nr:hypothetical protein [Methylobacterium planeticum]
MTMRIAEWREQVPEEARVAGIDVVFIAPAGAGASLVRRTILFALGEALPRIGECVILAFGAEPGRWQVQDVAHIFEEEGHGVAIKLMPPRD